MRRAFIVSLAVLGCACLHGQTTTFSFECYTPGPYPSDGSLGCEGIAGNGLGGSTISATPICGFPTNGLNYGVLVCNGPVATVPNGGPFPWPPSNVVTQIRIPIPVGSTAIAFDWEYHNAEGVGSSFNDGMAVSVVDPTGQTVLQQLVYADNQLALGSCSGNGTEVAPPGPQNFFGTLPPLPQGCEYLSVICWNEGDNAVAGAARIDNIVFNSGLAYCAVPCFAGNPILAFSSPFGLGSLQVNMSGLTSNGTYFLAVTLVPGTFPGGWFFGLDIPLQGLLDQLAFGFPFLGPTNGCGGATIGPFAGIPSGLPIYAVALGAIGPGLGTVTAISPAISYVVP
jgi:hypothetical protein